MEKDLSIDPIASSCAAAPTLRMRQQSEFSDDAIEATAAVQRMSSYRHRRCWQLFTCASIAIVAICSTLIILLMLRDHHSDPHVPAAHGQAQRRHSLEYFMLCVIGGILSGIPHVLMTPVDIVKCRMQCGAHRSIKEGLTVLLTEATSIASSNLSNRRRLHRQLAYLAVLYRGWVPTLIGYCLQGAFKFGFYEYFKYRYAAVLPMEVLVKYVFWVFVVSSASAELIADVALAPWETIKVRMQTRSIGSPPSSLSTMIPDIWLNEGVGAFFRCLVPLWCRQVPYTVVKFTTFEKCFTAIQYALRYEHPTHSQRIVVALLAGYAAGTLCAVVSQPADVVVSRLTAMEADFDNGGTSKLRQILRSVGFFGLWKGLSARVVLVGALSGAQWAIYDGFKVLSGAA